jgi:hypothetical protein
MEHVLEYSINELEVSGTHKLADNKTIGDRSFLVSPLAFIINGNKYTITIIVYTTHKKSLGNIDEYVAINGTVDGRNIYIRPALDKEDPRGIAFEYTISDVPKKLSHDEIHDLLGTHLTNFIEGLDYMIQEASEEFETVDKTADLLTYSNFIINKE